MSLRDTFDKTLNSRKTSLDVQDEQLIDLVKAAADYIKNDGNFSARLENQVLGGYVVLHIGTSGARFANPLPVDFEIVQKAYDDAKGDIKLAAPALAAEFVTRFAEIVADNRRNAAISQRLR